MTHDGWPLTAMERLICIVSPPLLRLASRSSALPMNNGIASASRSILPSSTLYGAPARSWRAFWPHRYPRQPKPEWPPACAQEAHGGRGLHPAADESPSKADSRVTTCRPPCPPSQPNSLQTRFARSWVGAPDIYSDTACGNWSIRPVVSSTALPQTLSVDYPRLIVGL